MTGFPFPAYTACRLKSTQNSTKVMESAIDGCVAQPLPERGNFYTSLNCHTQVTYFIVTVLNGFTGMYSRVSALRSSNSRVLTCTCYCIVVNTTTPAISTMARTCKASAQAIPKEDFDVEDRPTKKPKLEATTAISSQDATETGMISYESSQSNICLCVLRCHSPE